MFKPILTGMLLMGLSLWVVGQASQHALGDDKPAKKTEAAKEKASPAAKESRSAAAKESSCPASSNKKAASDSKQEKAKSRHQGRRPSHFWPGAPTRFSGGPWSRGHHAWGGGFGRFQVPWTQGPWTRGPWGGHRGSWGFHGHPGWGAGFGRFPGSPWAHGPRARQWDDPDSLRGPWMGWGGPRPFDHRPGSLSSGAFGPQGKAPAKGPSADELFKKFDANGDGSINKEEFAAGMKKIRERLGRPGTHLGPGMGPFAGPPGMRPPLAPPAVFARAGLQSGKPPSAGDWIERLDKNKDGKLVKDEAPERVWTHVSKADANKDGAVTKDELEAAHKKMMEQFRQKAQERAKEAKAAK